MDVEDLPFLQSEARPRAPAPSSAAGSVEDTQATSQVPPDIRKRIEVSVKSWQWLDDADRQRMMREIVAAEARVPGVSQRVTELLESFAWMNSDERNRAQVEVLAAAGRSPAALRDTIKDVIWYADDWDPYEQVVVRRPIEALAPPDSIVGYAEHPAAEAALREACGIPGQEQTRSRGRDREPAVDGPAREPQDNRTAKQRAAAIDREQQSHHGQRLPPVRGEQRPTRYAGDVALPHHSSLNDPARVTGARTRAMRSFKPRVNECVACEYKKLETRLPKTGVKDLGQEGTIIANPSHFGVGEKEYTLCKECHTVNGKINSEVYARWSRHTMREDTQRTFRMDPNFADIAERVGAAHLAQTGDKARDLVHDLIDASKDEAQLRKLVERDDDNSNDGITHEEVMKRMSDYSPGTGTMAPDFTGGGRRAEFAWGSYMNLDEPGRVIVPADPGRLRGFSDATYTHEYQSYDKDRFGKDEALAHVMNEQWDARRKENFRRAWERSEEIENPDRRHGLQSRLVERWDPRMALTRDGKIVETNPFAEPQPRLAPFARGTWHSGVDEGFADEGPASRSALARHEANVSAFLAEMKPKLLNQGYTQEEVKAMLRLPELNPEPEKRALKREGNIPLDVFGDPAPPLHQRIAAERRWHPHLAPAEQLDHVVNEAAARRQALDAAPAEPLTTVRTDPQTVVALAVKIQERGEFTAAIREADEQREKVQRYAGAMRQADLDVSGATKNFATEIRQTFRDPQAFQTAFKELSDDQKRAALAALRDRPESFAKEFATGFGKDFGRAGEIAAGRRPGTAAVGDVERAGILTADAGVRYLDAVRDRDYTRRHAAERLGLEAAASLREVRETCRAQMAAANEKKTSAIAGRDSLGKAPTPGDLGRAFNGLDHTARRDVIKQLPGISAMMETPTRQRALSGPSL